MQRKQLALVCAALFSASLSLPSYAMRDGLYIGLQVGYADTDYDANNLGLQTLGGIALGTASVKSDSNGIGGRLLGGFQFSQYLAAEVGFSAYQSSEIKNIYGVAGADLKATPYAGDLVGKLILPLGENFSAYTKLGVALEHVKYDANSTAKNIATLTGTSANLPSNKTKARATYGIGAAYDINPAFTLDASWIRIQGGAGMENIDFASLGLLLHLE